eukprot:2821196-Pyramimonas_sp.AAC.1
MVGNEHASGETCAGTSRGRQDSSRNLRTLKGAHAIRENLQAPPRGIQRKLVESKGTFDGGAPLSAPRSGGALKTKLSRTRRTCANPGRVGSGEVREHPRGFGGFLGNLGDLEHSMGIQRNPADPLQNS